MSTKDDKFKMMVLTYWATKSFDMKGEYPYYITLSKDIFIEDEVNQAQTYYRCGEIHDVDYSYLLPGQEFLWKMKFPTSNEHKIFKKIVNSSKWIDIIPLDCLESLIKFSILNLGLKNPSYFWVNKGLFICKDVTDQSLSWMDIKVIINKDNIDRHIHRIVSITKKLSSIDTEKKEDKTPEEYQEYKEKMLHYIIYDNEFGYFDSGLDTNSSSSLTLWYDKFDELIGKKSKNILSKL